MNKKQYISLGIFLSSLTLVSIKAMDGKKHREIVKSDNAIHQIREEVKIVLQQHKRKSLPHETTPLAFKQHSTSPVLMGEKQQISSTNIITGITVVPDGSEGSRATTPREGEMPGAPVRNFGGGDHNSTDTEFFKRKSFVEALRDFRTQEAALTCSQVKEILQQNKKNKTCNNRSTLICAGFCAGVAVIVSLELIIVGFLAAVFARQK